MQADIGDYLILQFP